MITVRLNKTFQTSKGARLECKKHNRCGHTFTGNHKFENNEFTPEQIKELQADPALWVKIDSKGTPAPAVDVVTDPAPNVPTEPEASADEPGDGEERVRLSEMKLKELQDFCRDLNISPGNKSKATLIDLLAQQGYEK